MIPLRFLQSYSKDFRIVRVGLSGLTPLDHYRFGSTISRTAEELDRKTLFIASGDLSHKLSPDGPYGFAPEGARFDKACMKYLEEGDFLKLLQVLENFMPVFKEVRASGSFNIYWSLLEYHNNYSKKLVKALINLSSGNVGAAENDFNNFTEYIQKNEMKFQKFLDVYRIIEVSSRYTGFKVL